MQKVYLLLRNNLQAGPYTLEELLTLGVKQTDLIWVEGKSAAWRYPAEIKELNTSAPATIENSFPKKEIHERKPAAEKRESVRVGNKKIFVSLPFQARKTVEEQSISPEDHLEQKAEALRQRLQTYTTAAERETEKAPLETGYSRSLQEMEENYTSWKIAQNKKKPKLKKQQVYAALIVTVIVSISGYFIFHSKSESLPEVATIINKETPITPAADEMVNPALHFDEEPGMAVNDEGKNNIDNIVVKKADNRKDDKKPSLVDKADSGLITQTDNATKKESTPEATATEPEITATTTTKKKTLGEAIDGFFGKFKKDKKEEAPNAGTSANADGVRRSSKRDEPQTNTPPAPEELAQQVKVTASEPADNWMLGIKGLKLTLHNLSDYKLSNAAVEVAYFDEQNTLLEKKTVLFKNVPPNKTTTLSAPDHRMATYAKHQLLTVSGE